MRKKLTTHGNSLALVIEKPVLRLLGITAATTLDISTDGESILVSPAGRARRRRMKFLN